MNTSATNGSLPQAEEPKSQTALVKPGDLQGQDVTISMQHPQPDSSAVNGQGQSADISFSKHSANPVSVKVVEETTPYPALEYGSPKMIVTLLVALLLVWTFGWLYMGTAWNPRVRVRSLTVAVLNCDTGLTAAQQQQLMASGSPSLAARAKGNIGSTLLGGSVWNHSSPASRVFKWRNFTCNAVRSLSPPPSTPGCPASVEPACLAQLKHEVLHGEFWAAIFLPSNLTSNTISTAVGTNTSAQYRPLPLHYIKSGGRHLTTYGFIDAGIRSIHLGLSQALASSFASDASLASRMNPFFYISPLPLSTVDLAPVRYFGQNLAAYLLMLLTWISSIVIVATMHDYRLPVEVPEKHPQLNPTRAHYARALFIRHVTAIGCTLVAACINLLVVIFLGVASGDGAQFEGYNAGYAIAFIWFTSWTFLAVNSLLINTFGPIKYSIFSTFILVLQLATSTAILSYELSNPFFQLGYALPFTWGVTGLRTIFFGGLKNKMWLAWVVLTAWLLVTSSAISLLWFVRTKGKVRSAGGEGGAQQGAGERGRDTTRELGQASMAFPLT